MSTQVDVENRSELKASTTRLRSDDVDPTRRAWLIVAHVHNNPNKIQLLAEGEGFDECLDKLADDQVMYIMFRLSRTIDMSTTVKFVYIHWVGERVKPLLRGRFGVVHGSVMEHLPPFHLQLETSSRGDIVEQDIIDKLDDSSGTRSKVLEGSLDGRQMRGFTQHQVPKQQTGQLRSVAPDGVVVNVGATLKDAIAQVRDDTNDTRWVLAGYQDNSLHKPLDLVAMGCNDLDELTEKLEDDRVMYGLYRTADVIDDIKTVKFVYIYWVGEKVKPLIKGKVSAYAGPVEKHFSPMHVCLSFTNRYDITPKVISDKVTASSGSRSFVK